jgi:hypothetical protein
LNNIIWKISAFVILPILVLNSCLNNKNTKFLFENCNVSDITLNKSILVTDSLGLFSFQVPDSSWKPERFLDDENNGLTVGDTSLGFLRLLNVNQSDYEGHWNWDEEQINVEQDFNVIETGDFLFNEQTCRYNIVLFEIDRPQMVSFYLTILDTTYRRQYTVSLSTENHPDYKKRICTMKPIIETLKIKN